MKARYILMSALAAVSLQSVLQARQYYAPYAADQVMHASGSNLSRKSTMNVFASSYLKEAHDAFMAHGTKTKSLSALYFNKDEFRLSQLFENCLVPMDTKNYNVFMRIAKVKPRIQYSEYGTQLGFSLDQSVMNGKGRLGLRARTSVKKMQVERIDADAALQGGDLFYNARRDIDPTAYSEALYAYRLDFLEGVLQSTHDTSVVTSNSTDGVKFYGTQATKPDSADPLLNMNVVYSPEGVIPHGQHVGALNIKQGFANSEIAGEVPVTLDGLQENLAYQFKPATEYVALKDDQASSVNERVLNQDKKASLWVVNAVKSTGLSPRGRSSTSDLKPLYAGDNFALSGSENTDHWLAARGFVFATDKHVGLGDTTLELFYAHEFSAKLSMELNGGLVMPTAAGKKSYGNPYHVHLGNCGHTELFGGLSFSWQPANWIAFDLQGSYGEVFKNREQRMAVPIGSLVKNIGPRADAEVSWHRANAQAGLTLMHPRMRNLRTSLAYRFGYKSAEKIVFDDSTTASWLGKKYVAATGAFTTANDMTLSCALAAANTEAFAHVVAASSVYDVNDYLSFNCGGSYTVAGKNMPQETEMHVGCVVKF